MMRLAAALLALAALPAAANVCDRDTIPPTTPDSRYQTGTDPDSGRAQVTDLVTGLVWMRCSLGQSFDAGEGRCLGAPERYTWGEALNAAVQYPGWRLPTLKELQSLVDAQCYGPAINTTVFPDTPSSWTPDSPNLLSAPIGYWSSTPFAGTDGQGHYSNAWMLRPFLGDAAPAGKANPGFVRLVRDPAP